MGNWASFEESFIHTNAHKVLGHRLRPFSLYHQLILEAISSPIMGGSGIVTLIDLEIACRICASDYNGYQDASRRIGWFGKLRWGIKALTRSLEKEAAKFDAYFSDFVALPETHGQGGSQEGKTYHEFPAPLSVAGCLMANGFESGRRKEIWMTPLGEAHWYCATFLRLDGADLNLITEHDREIMDGLRRRKKEKAQKEAEEAAQKAEESKNGEN